MSTQPVTQRTGLVSFAWLHAENCGDNLNNVHQSWNFLPWHRAFLYFHERALQSVLGPSFRLPVWDWENGNDVPEFYTAWAVRMGTKHLNDTLGKDAQSNNIPDATTLRSWIASHTAVEFLGGPRLEDPASGSAADGTPHKYPHAQIHGLMADFQVAGADPLFFAHHANIDRYWDYWRIRYGFPDDSDWLKGSFVFYDEKGAPVSITAQQLIDVDRLGYCYAMPDRSLTADYDSRSPGKPELDGTLVQFDVDQLRQIMQLAINAGKKLLGTPASELIAAVFAEVGSAVQLVKDIRVPIRITGTSGDAPPGASYRLLLRNALVLFPAIDIGRFGLVKSAHTGHGGPVSSVVNCGLAVSDLVKLITWAGMVKFVSQPESADDSGGERPFRVSRVEFLVPKV